MEVTIAVDSSQKLIFEFHGLEGLINFEFLARLDLDIGLVLQFGIEVSSFWLGWLFLLRDHPLNFIDYKRTII